MKKTKLLSALLLLALLVSLLVPASAAAAADSAAGDETASDSAGSTDGSGDAAADAAASDAASAPTHTVQATSAMLIELSSGQVLLEQNADAQIYPASLTKIMTCMLTLEHGTLTDVVTVSETALQNLDAAGSTAGLLEGEQLTVEQLLYCMMLSSANEACNVAAEYVSGSVDAFVELMNEEAAALGCTGTHFANPHGLHDENHYTTARDLSIIATAALQSEKFREITSTVTYTVPATNLSEERQLFTTNLLETPNTDYYYEYASGVKTGFTTPAGRCLISTAQRPDSELHLLSVLCGASEEGQNFTETEAMFEWGFDNFAFATVLEANPVTEIPVFMSAGSDAAVLAASREITAVLPADFDESLVELDIQLTSPDGVEAPVTKGQVLGTVTVRYLGTDLGTADLVAITDTPRSELAATAASTQSFLSEHFWLLLIGAVVLLFILYLVINNVRRARRRRRRQLERARRRGEVIDFPGRREDEEDQP